MRISVQEAIDRLNDGDVVALPTETVYGLAASLLKSDAIENIFKIKGRPQNNPLIVHLAEPDDCLAYALELPPQARLLMESFWPGSMTVILPVDPLTIPATARAQLPSAAFRLPRHPLTLAVLKETGPLVMPSANLSGKPSATRPDHVEADFGSDFPVVDGGPCQQGMESTILHFSQERWEIARLGALPPEAFESVLGYAPEIIKPTSKPICPGQLFRHYAPRAKLLLQQAECHVAEVKIGFQERSYTDYKHLYLLGSLEKPGEAAEKLYHLLRQLDVDGVIDAWVDMDFPRDSLWRTIRERLERAAAGVG